MRMLAAGLPTETGATVPPEPPVLPSTRASTSLSASPVSPEVATDRTSAPEWAKLSAVAG